MKAKRSGQAKAGKDTKAGKLIRKLLRKIVRPRASSAGKPDQGPPAESSLPPAGKRTGRGASSVKPYLDQTRNTRPGPLE